MTISINTGSITVGANPDATADPVVDHPVDAAATYAAFAEAVFKSGLAEVIFDALPIVANFNTPGSSKVPWPDGYGTNTPPWGRPADGATGYQEITMIDDLPDVRLWTDGINSQAIARKGTLDYLAELSVAIAAGIKSAIESTFQSGRATLVAGTKVVSATFTSSADILIERRTSGGTPGTLSVTSITPGSPGSFTISSTSGSDTSEVSWFIAGA